MAEDDNGQDLRPGKTLHIKQPDPLQVIANRMIMIEASLSRIADGIEYLVEAIKQERDDGQNNEENIGS